MFLTIFRGFWSHLTIFSSFISSNWHHWKEGKRRFLWYYKNHPASITTSWIISSWSSCIQFFDRHCIIISTIPPILFITNLKIAHARNRIRKATGRWLIYHFYRFSGWRDSTVQLLRDFRNSVGNNLQPQDSSPVVVLVLSNYDLSVDKLSSAAKDLQELGWVWFQKNTF